MRPMDGVELTRRLRQIDFPAKVILPTTFETDEQTYRGFKAGIATCILKDIEIVRLVHAIPLVRSGQRIIHFHIGATLAEHVAAPSLTARYQRSHREGTVKAP